VERDRLSNQSNGKKRKMSLKMNNVVWATPRRLAKEWTKKKKIGVEREK
jgi:hypothetical protein